MRCSVRRGGLIVSALCQSFRHWSRQVTVHALRSHQAVKLLALRVRLLTVCRTAICPWLLLRQSFAGRVLAGHWSPESQRELQVLLGSCVPDAKEHLSSLVVLASAPQQLPWSASVHSLTLNPLFQSTAVSVG